ncbi:hypothetical protein RRV45_12805 [Bacillus sp. DTU_2020_1000418_1_SI_GHA_SEK_038]|uniref:hypothetical protein n=1 Tax=Bacillus sp. DTU_2020_1000418_1_SI_GHA_SEK_038 TaxID=3077585 RepID=UPI0028E6C7E4|nr:hypothetical protein [Bacillus sp. DTU_2020_1000418_1_SI_GHA_SEK_038]WNS73798.1 hypothetical protein RRV45_12805 [Bacillus sp. DTU_2020_1000418_1_SI_GHA_SEK_038]
MWFWFQAFIMIIILWILIEEGIYFFVNRSIFGQSFLEKKWRSFFKWAGNKLKRNAS